MLRQTGFALLMAATMACHAAPAAAQYTPAAAQTSLLAPEAVRTFYEARGQTPAWSGDARFDALLEAIEGVAAHGLNPADYHGEALRRMRGDPAAREHLATDAWLSAAAHMAYGKLSPDRFEPDWSAARRQIDLAAHLQVMLETGGIAGSLDRLAPREPAYRALVTELARLRQAEERVGLPVPPGPLLRPGMTSPRMVAVRARLAQLGYAIPDTASDRYDERLVSTVQAFQFDNGLEADGLIGNATVNALNLTTAAKIEKVRINLERWRWLPADLGLRHVRVNIAAFEVSAHRDGQTLRTYRAVVGRPYRKTPVFSDEIRYIVFNPWWETPHKLARLDKLPAFQKDPAMAERQGFQVLDRSGGGMVDLQTIDWNAVSADNFPYRLRQAPGEANALGQVKIMFPNHHAVYLHDTPSQELFERQERAFSSGCVRVQHVMDLTEWLLLETPGWDRARIDAAVASGRETRVNLLSPVPVHLLYMTATVEPDGQVRYRTDIYARDARVLEGLERRPLGNGG